MCRLTDRPAAAQSATSALDPLVADHRPSSDSTRLSVPWLLSRSDTVRAAQYGTGLRLHLDHDFDLGGAHWTLGMDGTDSMDHAIGKTAELPMWQSELVLHLPHGFFVGATTETFVALPPAVGITAGRSF
jgi:hypothetical protein